VGSVGLGVTFDFLLESVPATLAHSHATARWWQWASAATLLALLGWFAVDDARRLLGRLRVARHVAGGAEIEIGVEGMTCGACAAKLESALRGERGVRAVSVSLADRKAVVHGTVDEALVRGAILRVGFKPWPTAG